MNFFSSDWHLGHERLLTLGKGRPFASIDVMNETLIANINATVGPDDTLYMLGDWCCGVGSDKVGYLRATRGRLHCKTIHMIRGNHDPSIRSGALGNLVRDGVLASVSEMLTIRDGRTEIVLCHYPLEHWEFESAGTMMLHGHLHGAGVRHETRQRLDIGVDGHDYKPWSRDEVFAEIKSKRWDSPEHHG